MQDIALVEESIELLPRIGRFFSAMSKTSESPPLSNAQSRAIALLYVNGDLTVGEVAAGLGIHMPAASELIDRLEKDGLATRTVDPGDRRRAVIGLTAAALEYAYLMHDQRRAQVRAALEQLTPDERPIFLKALRALAAIVDESERT